MWIVIALMLIGFIVGYSMGEQGFALGGAVGMGIVATCTIIIISGVRHSPIYLPAQEERLIAMERGSYFQVRPVKANKQKYFFSYRDDAGVPRVLEIPESQVVVVEWDKPYGAMQRYDDQNHGLYRYRIEYMERGPSTYTLSVPRSSGT